MYLINLVYRRERLASTLVADSSRGTLENAMRRLTLLMIGGLVPAPAAAQQVLEIDYTAGRTIIDGEWRHLDINHLAMGGLVPAPAAAHPARGVLYAFDPEEPEGVMAFSLEEWIRTIPTPQGDGPGEFPEGRQSMAIARDGGLYVSGFVRVLKFDTLGGRVSSWTPVAPARRAVCDLGGEPAVPTQNGVLRHGPDDTHQAIGPNAVESEGIQAQSVEEGMAINRRLMSARIACTDDVAYVVMTYDSGTDSVFAYHRSGETGRVALPTEGIEGMEECRQIGVGNLPPGFQPVGGSCRYWSLSLRPSIDDHGNLVLLGRDWVVAGTIIDPETGCHALVQKDFRADLGRQPVRILGDSVLVVGQDTDVTETPDGRFNARLSGVNNRVSLHPLRRISGEPCPGMLPTVGDGG